MQTILMVAFHYPPYEGGSGVHRTLKFSHYLPNHGWTPMVLSAHPWAYARTGSGQLGEIPSAAIIKRAFALDTARHLALGGRYTRLLALPDQWVTWWFGAVCSGLRLIRRHRPAVLWSTYPIATAHLIGLTLHRLTGVPWVVDFRDSMTEENYPRDKWSRRAYLWIEKRVVEYASRLIFTAPSTRQMYLERYPSLSADRCLLIANGYDEEDFAGIEISKAAHLPNGRPVRLLHAGVIYTDDRDPRAFFSALSRLKRESVITRDDLLIDLRASGSEEYYAALLKDLCIDDMVRLLPPVSHREALEECATADALLLFQAASCNHQIPAKVYEYLRLGKPIFALTPTQGDTGQLLLQAGGATVVDLADEEGIYQAIPSFLEALRCNRHPLPTPEEVLRCSRKHQTMQLAACLSELSGQA